MLHVYYQRKLDVDIRFYIDRKDVPDQLSTSIAYPGETTTDINIFWCKPSGQFLM